MSNKPPIEVPQGAIRLNTDSQKLEFFAQDRWYEFATNSPNLAESTDAAAGTRGIWSGQASWPSAPYNTSVIDAVSLASTGNTFDFGDNTEARRGGGQCASNTRALLAGGYNNSGNRSNTIDFVTISSTGDGTDFGDRTTIGNAVAAAGNQTRGVFLGASTPSSTNIIDFVTIASTGNAVDFGDATNTNNNNTGFGSPTRGIFGANGPNGNVMFITYATTGNATDFHNFSHGRTELPAGGSNTTRGIFAGGERQPSGTSVDTIDFMIIPSLGDFINFGDLTKVIRGAGGAASPTRLVIAGGSNPDSPNGFNSIEYVTFSTQGDAVDFGDLTLVKHAYNGTSNGHGGL